MLANDAVEKLLPEKLLPEKLLNGEVLKLVKGEVEKLVKGEVLKLVKGEVEKLVKGEVEKLVKGEVEKLVKGEVEKLVKGKVEKLVKEEGMLVSMSTRPGARASLSVDAVPQRVWRSVGFVASAYRQRRAPVKHERYRTIFQL